MPLLSPSGLLIGVAFVVVVLIGGLSLSLALYLPRARPQLDWIEFAFIAIMLGLALALWLGLVLASLGWFSLASLLGSMAVVALVTGLIVLRRGAARSLAEELTRPTWVEVALIGLLAAFAVVYFRPHESITGAADAGVYVNMGATIAGSGRLLIDDPFIAQIEPSLYPAFFRQQPPDFLTRYYYLPGYYLSDSVPGRIIPQFYALQAVSIAIFTAIGGVSIGLLATPLWGLLGIAATFFLTRGLFGRRAALVAALLVAVVATQIWFARYPTAEVLTQAYLFAGLYALSRTLRQHAPSGAWGFLAGAWLGLIFLARIDMILVAVVLLILLLGLAAVRQWHFGLSVFTLTLGALIVHSAIHALILAWPYTYNTYQAVFKTLLGRSGFIWLGTGVVALVALFVGLRLFDRIRAERRVRILHWLRVALIVIVIGAALYAYFMRPYFESAAAYTNWYDETQVALSNRENLVRIGWYVTPLGLALALVGLCAMIWRERSIAVDVFVAVGLLSTVVYVINILNNPQQIYAMRRYVPVVMPALVVWGAYGLAAASRNRYRWVQAAVIIVAFAWLGGMLWQSRVIGRQVDSAGMISALTDLNRQLEPGAVLLIDDQSPVGIGDIIGTPLRFIFEHPVFVLRDSLAMAPDALQSIIRRWQRQGRSVYVIGDAARELSVNKVLPLGTATHLAFTTAILASTYTEYPNQVVPQTYDLKIYAVAPLNVSSAVLP